MDGNGWHYIGKPVFFATKSAAERFMIRRQRLMTERLPR